MSGTDIHPPLLTATYRVQMNHAFRFPDALGIVPYLHSLGVSHLYVSPILAARRGSMHGYDVADPTRVNPELGTEDDLRALAAALHERGMGLVVDIVPNHMGTGPDNPFWEDVLAHGERSRYARWFDIDWRGAPGHRKIVLPVLGDELDAVLTRGELRLDVGDSDKRLLYGQQSFPLDPGTLTPEMQLALWDPEAITDPTALLASTEGREGLRHLLEAQHYRLTFWRHAPTELNYRRFFDVNELVALRMEDPAVFAETHALVLRWVREGVVDGLRVDHVDGLADPLGYLQRLREAVGDAAFPIVVEKILSPGERLRADWPVQGTTGYEFLNDLEDVFLDGAGFDAIERCYRRMRRLPAAIGFGEFAWRGKTAMLKGALQPDVQRLVSLLEPLASAEGHGDWPAARLAEGLVQFMAALPVYRTYLDGRTAAACDDDRAVIECAMTEATRRGQATADVVGFIGAVLREGAGRGTAGEGAWLAFVQRLQQTSGPATAKGVEDTALYQYVPLASRNEVGGAPDRPLGDAVGRLHAANAERAARWPASLICTNTHDTKRSADVRARLDVVSELPREWERHTRRWRRLNSRHRTVVNGRVVPEPNTEYLFYQTLVGLWPSPRSGRRADDLPDRAWRAAARERLERYMLKAVREAKVRTSWIDPDAAYEDGVRRFIGGVLEPNEDAPFLADVARLVARIAPAAALVSLARVLVHLTAPGTPDVYQGDEDWNFALVDPDNRSPVDYGRRAESLAREAGGGRREAPGGDAGRATRGASTAQAVAAPHAHLDKLGLTATLLRARRDNSELFTSGGYEPLLVDGARAGQLLAFGRAWGEVRAIVVAPRLLAQVAGTDGSEPVAWGSTCVALPEGYRGRRWRSVLTGEELGAEETVAGTLPASLILHHPPLALLLSSR